MPRLRGAHQSSRLRRGLLGLRSHRSLVALAGQPHADLVIVGQDWGDTRYFAANRGRDAARNPTNETLRSLLASIGIEIAPPAGTDAGGGEVFMTNAILCFKQG